MRVESGAWNRDSARRVEVSTAEGNHVDRRAGRERRVPQRVGIATPGYRQFRQRVARGTADRGEGTADENLLLIVDDQSVDDVVRRGNPVRVECTGDVFQSCQVSNVLIQGLEIATDVNVVPAAVANAIHRNLRDDACRDGRCPAAIDDPGSTACQFDDSDPRMSVGLRETATRKNRSIRRCRYADHIPIRRRIPCRVQAAIGQQAHQISAQLAIGFHEAATDDGAAVWLKCNGGDGCRLRFDVDGSRRHAGGIDCRQTHQRRARCG